MPGRREDGDVHMAKGGPQDDDGKMGVDEVCKEATPPCQGAARASKASQGSQNVNARLKQAIHCQAANMRIEGLPVGWRHVLRAVRSLRVAGKARPNESDSKIAQFLRSSLLSAIILVSAAAILAEEGNPRELEAKALAGDPRSQYLMGLDSRPLGKKETEQNLEDAYAWFAAAAARGYYRAAFELDMVNRALQRTGRTEKAKARYREISTLMADKPREELTYRLIEDPAVGYKFYASNRWGEPKTEGNKVTLQLKTGGTAWLMLEPCTPEADKEMRDRIKSSDPVLAMDLVEAMKKQFGDARLIKHWPSNATVAHPYCVLAEIPADTKYRARVSLIVLWPGVDRVVVLQFTAFKETFQSELDEFNGLVETYAYTPPSLTKGMEDFLNGLSLKK